MASTIESPRTVMADLRPAAHAFDTIAPAFEARFSSWQSVSAQRRAVRAALLRVFPAGGRILELGGGTGEDASFLAMQGLQVVLTDPSPAMVSIARAKLARHGGQAVVASAEEMDDFADRHISAARPLFDGAFSNFAPLNCVPDLTQTALGLARLLKPGASAMLVLFGTFCPGEMVTEVLRHSPHLALRRLKQGRIPARLAGQTFDIVYHRRPALQRAFAPWFVLERRIGIGITVPPSAAEPWISEHPRLLKCMEAFDQLLSRPLAIFGDHVLYQFRRTDATLP